MITPQTHEATLEETKVTAEVVNGQVPAAAPANEAFSNAPGTPGRIGSGSAGGVGSAISRGLFRAKMADALEQGTAVGEGRELGDLFEYKLKDRISIRKNQSALVPILQSRINAEKVSMWNPSQPAVLRGLWLENTSGMTLDGGSFNVLEDGAFAGEGLLDPVKPGEKRLLSYAADLGLLVDSKQKSENQQVTRVRISHGVMWQTTEERQEQTYTIRNRDTSPRTLVIEHPARPGWKLAEGADPAETSASFHRFRIGIEPKKTATLIVKEYHPTVNRYELSNLTDEQITFFASQKMINPAVEKALRQIAERKSVLAALSSDIASRKSSISTIAEDQQRVRENMRALKGSAEEKALVERYVRELNDQEDRVQSLQRDIADLKQKQDAAHKALNQMMENLVMDTTL